MKYPCVKEAYKAANKFGDMFLRDELMQTTFIDNQYSCVRVMWRDRMTYKTKEKCFIFGKCEYV